jgi:DNA-binding PadR family transcriptional regulator
MEKRETRYPPGKPMNEEELREWKKAFSDIEESINNLKEEDNERNVGQDCGTVRKEGGQSRNEKNKQNYVQGCFQFF